MAEVGVVDQLLAIERLLAAHRDDLDALNVFPVPDADTGHNVLATVRAARVAAEQAVPGERGSAAVNGALRGARGNAGVLVSQVLRGILGPEAAWPARLARADELARAAVAHPVEGTLLTAVRAAAVAAAGHDDPGAQLAAAAVAAHRAVEESPGRLEVLARAGVVDAGARAVALVLEALAALAAGTEPAPPTVEVPADGPQVVGCTASATRFEVMYLLAPAAPDAASALRGALTRVGDSVVVVGADHLVSVHVHTDDIGAALDAGLVHGRPHRIRVEDLQAPAETAASRTDHPAAGAAITARVGLVVGADGVGVAGLAAQLGAITVPLPATRPVDVDALVTAIGRAGSDRVVVLPGTPQVAVLAGGMTVAGTEVVVVTSADDPARVLAALAVLDPQAPDVALLTAVAAGVRTGAVREVGQEWEVVVGTAVVATAPDALAAMVQLAAALATRPPELASLLLGADIGVALRDAVTAALAQAWRTTELEVVDAGLRTAAFVVGVEGAA